MIDPALEFGVGEWRVIRLLSADHLRRSVTLGAVRNFVTRLEAIGVTDDIEFSLDPKNSDFFSVWIPVEVPHGKD